MKDKGSTNNVTNLPKGKTFERWFLGRKHFDLLANILLLYSIRSSKGIKLHINQINNNYDISLQ